MTDRPLIWKMSNDDISAMGQRIYFMFDSRFGILGQRIEWCCFRFDQIQYSGHELGATCRLIVEGRVAYPQQYEEARNKRAALN